MLVRHLLRVRDVPWAPSSSVAATPPPWCSCRSSAASPSAPASTSVIYSRVSTVFNLIAAFAAMIWAWLGSSFGFTVEFVVALAMLVVILLLGLYIFKAAAD
ncbi:MAG: hypothetical protein ACLTDR_00135 [Adlercreutzia equolifaciens]